MQQIPIYFKSDFKLFIRTEAGFAVPFKFEFYTNMPSRPYIVKFDGHKYHNCELLEDGRLCIAFDDHGFGLGKLMIRQSYYLNDADYASEICDRVIAPQPVVNIDDNLLRSEIVLALSGDDTIEFTSQLPPYYQAGLTPEEHQALIDATERAEAAADDADNARRALDNAYKEKVAAIDADLAVMKKAFSDDFIGDETRRQETFDTNEANRQETFDTSEVNRQAIFESKEKMRDAANKATLEAAERLKELESKLSENCEITSNRIYYPQNGKLYSATNNDYKSTDYRRSSGDGSPVVLKRGDELYVKAAADSLAGNLTVFITEFGEASIGKTIIDSFGDTEAGKKYVATQDCEAYITNCMSIEPAPVAVIMAGKYPSKTYVDKKIAGLEVDLDKAKQEAIAYTAAEVGKKQDTLMSGMNIKTINGEPILGAGNIDTKKGHWESKDMTNAFGDANNRMWIIADGKLRISSSALNYVNTGCHEGTFGKELVTAKKGNKVEITCGIARGDVSEGRYAVLITAAGGAASLMKPIINSFSNAEAMAGISFIAEEDIELYVNNFPDVVAEPSIVISKYVSDENYVTRDEVEEELSKKQDTLKSGENIKTFNGQSILGTGNIEADGINPWKGKKMLIMGASSAGRGSATAELPKYYSYAIRTAELLGMQLIDRTSNPRIYAAGGKAYQWKENGGSLVVYTDLTEAEFATWDKDNINYYHFQENRGDRSLKWQFVSYNKTNKQLTLKKDGTSHIFTLDTSVTQPLAGLFNLGASATIAEFEATGRSDRKSESYENYLLDTSIDLLVLSNQGIEVDATGVIDEQIVPLMRRPTDTNRHFHYADGVSLAERRNSNTGSMFYLIEKIVQANPKVRVVFCNDANIPTDGDGRGDWGLARTLGYLRFKQTAVMAIKFGIPFLNHAEKLMLNYANWSVYGYSDNQHPSEAMYKWMGEMFAGELLAGTMNDAASYWFTDVVEHIGKVPVIARRIEEKLNLGGKDSRAWVGMADQLAPSEKTEQAAYRDEVLPAGRILGFAPELGPSGAGTRDGQIADSVSPVMREVSGVSGGANQLVPENGGSVNLEATTTDSKGNVTRKPYLHMSNGTAEIIRVDAAETRSFSKGDIVVDVRKAMPTLNAFLNTLTIAPEQVAHKLGFLALQRD